MSGRIALAAALLLAFAFPAAADEIEGVYLGTAQSGDEVRVTTIFTVSDLGIIDGVYAFDTATGAEAGELTDCSLEELLLRCIWHDSFGDGDFLAQFEPTFASFMGGWFPDVSPEPRPGFEGSNFWTGIRTP